MILQTIRNAETNRIEYKRELTSDLEQEAIAFLNYKEGGVIYIGIDKIGTGVGVPGIDSDILKIKDCGIRLLCERRQLMPSSTTTTLRKYHRNLNFLTTE